MLITRLQVQNFRCFEQATFEFRPGFNLLVGVNGSGKTSLLKVIAAGMVTPFNGLGKGVVEPYAEEANARLALVELQGRVRYERCYPVRLDVVGDLCGKQRTWWMEQPGPGSQPKREHTIWSALADEAAQIVQGGPGVLPVAAYYSAERQWKLSGVTADAAVRQQDSRLNAYLSWHEAALDMKGLEAWVIGKSLERLESMSDNGYVLSSGPLNELELVNRAVAAAIPGSKGLRYDIKYRRMVLDWIDADPTPFETLSDGQRALAALMADIGRRMCLLNPQSGDKVLQATPGVVLIDELDMHLHPAWQRRIAGVLKAVFPLVQFFAASHSPQIIGELNTEEILLMRDGQVLGHPERSFGLDSGDVLAEIMDTSPRNAEVAERLAHIRRALDDETIDRVGQELAELEAMVGPIPDVLEARSALESLRWLGEEGEA